MHGVYSSHMQHLLASRLLRIGLAFSFLYVAVSCFLDAAAWVDFFPDFIASSPRAELLVHLHAVGDLFLALWLLSGKWAKWAGIASAAVMAAIVVTNYSMFDIMFRDVSIAFMGLGLWALHRADA